MSFNMLLNMLLNMFFITLFMLPVATNANILSLENYLNLVERENLNYQSGVEQSQGQVLMMREADLLNTPHLFINGRYGVDGKLPNPPIYGYDQLKTQNYSLGVSQEFDFGMRASFSYEFNKTSLDAGSSGGGFISNYSLWEISPKLELTVPLWGGGFGKTMHANQELIRKQNLSASYAVLAGNQGLLAQAEVGYWRLSIARESVKILEGALKSAREIHNYVLGKRKKNLGEDADILQARALVESYELQIQEAKNEVLAARRAFNLFLNRDMSQDVPELEIISYHTLENLSVPKERPGERYDVASIRHQNEALKAQSVLIEERNKPTLNLIGGYILNGQDGAFDRAFNDSRKNSRNTRYIGVGLEVPLNYFARNDAIEGARLLARASALKLSHQEYEQDQNWYEITQKIFELKTTLKLSRTMENAQKLKLENERKRLRQGRTTTYQVLLFEQDYSLAQAARLRQAMQILSLHSQVKLYSFLK